MLSFAEKKTGSYDELAVGQVGPDSFQQSQVVIKYFIFL